jgi:hypothetical protein
MPLDYSYVPLCQTWPVASPKHPAGRPVPPGVTMPDVPALVLTGDLDTITTPAEGDRAAALFRNAKRVIVANTGHVTAVGDEDECASVIVRTFIAREPIDPACAKQIPAIRLVPSFARRIEDVPRPNPVGMRRWNDTDLREAAAAVYAAGDALARADVLDESKGTGLRGGTFTATRRNGKLHIVLHGVKWTDDLAADGTLTYDEETGHVGVSLQMPGAAIRATWKGTAGDALAHITGTIGGRQITAQMFAP